MSCQHAGLRAGSGSHEGDGLTLCVLGLLLCAQVADGLQLLMLCLQLSLRSCKPYATHAGITDWVMCMLRCT